MVTSGRRPGMSQRRKWFPFLPQAGTPRTGKCQAALPAQGPGELVVKTRCRDRDRIGVIAKSVHTGTIGGAKI
jgi:hypothetical protein